VIFVAVAAFFLMEPATAVLHRRVMHGGGWAWHGSHHVEPGGGWQRNDLFPVVFAAVTIAVMAVGNGVDGLAALLWAGVGVTAYGAAYLLVHDLYIHQRLGRLPGAGTRYVRWVTAAHHRHHQTAAGPFGFLCPVGSGP
jgi:beta-carotene 3-hydroxylase